MRENVRAFSSGFLGAYCSSKKSRVDGLVFSWLNLNTRRLTVRLRGLKPMRNETDTEISSEFVPKNEAARLAVERARRIVKDNKEMIVKMKEDSNIPSEEEDALLQAQNFSYEDSYAFDLYKIKSSNGFSDFFKDIFGVF